MGYVLRSETEFSGLDAASRSWLETSFMSDYNILCVRSPSFRRKELIALVRSGVVSFTLGINPALSARE
jgi:hypothetical protein